jgi:uncharacterized membrane protein YbhN (UPF0104 family)
VPRKRRRDVAIGLVVSLVSVSAVAWWASQQSRPTFPGDPAELALVGAGIAVYWGITMLRGWRWHSVMRRAEIDHRTADAYGLAIVGYMGNTVLPARGGEILRILLLGERSRSSRRKILGSIVAERLLDIVSLIGLLVAVTWLGIGGVPTGWAPAIIGVAAMPASALLVTILFRLRRSGRLSRFAEIVRPFVQASRVMFGRAGFALLGLTAVVWLLEGFNFWLIGRSLDLELSIAETVFLVVLTTLFSIIPAGPAYAGTFDAALVFGLSALDVTGGQAVAFTLLVRFVVFVPITVAGLVLLLVRYGGLPSLRLRTAPS